MQGRGARRDAIIAACWIAVGSAAGTLAQSAPPPAGPEPAAAQGRPAASAPILSWQAKEEFLLHARVVRSRGVGKGVTASLRATLSDGTLTHEAHIQTIDETKTTFEGNRGTELNFRDSWTYNVAAYRLSQLLGLDDMVPVSVQRKYDGKQAAVTWWVDDVLMDEAKRVKDKIEPPETSDWNNQLFIVRVFDQLIDNTDRNLGNLLITKDWHVWMIDHTRAFRRQTNLRAPQNLGRCDRAFLERMRALDKATLQEKLGRWLTSSEIEPLLARRDIIVAHFDGVSPSALFDRKRP